VDVAKEELSTNSTEKPFPMSVKREGPEDVRVYFPGGSFLLCAHGARVLAQELAEASKIQFCDGYRHGDGSTMYMGLRVEP
jgi:hypothetical protein